MNCYLGIDPSLSASGVFFLYDDPSQNTGYEICTQKKDFSSSIHRVDFIANRIIEDIRKRKPVAIMMEDYFTGKMPGTVIQLAELGTMIRTRILESGNKFAVTPPTRLKKFVSGNGNSGKELMLKNVFKKWGIDLTSNNIADACGIAYMCRAIYNKLNNIPQVLTKYEAECIKDYTDELSVVKPYKL